MCNDFRNNIPYSDYLAAFRQIRAPVLFPTAAPNLEPRDDIWPTELAPAVRRREDGVELVQLRWGFPPARPSERRSSTSVPKADASRKAVA
jgi:putative SOS response-associated peptidase YedK